MAKKVQQDWSKTLMKFVKVGVTVVAAGVAAVYGESQWYLLISPALASLSNVAKHKYGLDLKLI